MRRACLLLSLLTCLLFASGCASASEGIFDWLFHSVTKGQSNSNDRDLYNINPNNFPPTTLSEEDRRNPSR